MITRVQIKNFRNLADVDVHLGPLTVLVGRNGAGKSNFLDALRFVRDALNDGLETAISDIGGIDSIRCRSSQTVYDAIEIALELKTQDSQAYYSFSFGTEQQEKRRIQHEALQIIGNSQTNRHFTFETKAGQWVTLPSIFVGRELQTMLVSPDTLLFLAFSNLYEGITTVFRSVWAAAYYSVFPNTLRVPQRQSSKVILAEDGQNLATTLKSIIDDGQYLPDLISALARITQGIQDVRVTEVGGYLVTELKHETQSETPVWFPLAQESDGTLRVLALLAALYQKAPNHLIAIEEPELSIHPGALAVLSEVIEEAATRSQVIITTQSPDLISRFGVDQLRVVEVVDGNTRIGPIEEGQREAINEQLFSAGDLLRIEGLHVSQDESAAAHA